MSALIPSMAASLFYSSDDPYAIRIVFHSGPRNIEWIFARDPL
jgi:hypothetical protein